MKKNILLSALMLGMMLSPHRALSMDYAKQTAGYYLSKAASGAGYYLPSAVKNLGPWASRNLSSLNRNHLLAVFVTAAGLLGLKVVYDKWGNPADIELKEKGSNPEEYLQTPEKQRHQLAQQKIEEQYGPPQHNLSAPATTDLNTAPVLSVPTTTTSVLPIAATTTVEAQDLLSPTLSSTVTPALAQQRFTEEEQARLKEGEKQLRVAEHLRDVQLKGGAVPKPHIVHKNIFEKNETPAQEASKMPVVSYQIDIVNASGHDIKFKLVKDNRGIFLPTKDSDQPNRTQLGSVMLPKNPRDWPKDEKDLIILDTNRQRSDGLYLQEVSQIPSIINQYIPLDVFNSFSTKTVDSTGFSNVTSDFDSIKGKILQSLEDNRSGRAPKFLLNIAKPNFKNPAWNIYLSEIEYSKEDIPK